MTKVNGSVTWDYTYNANGMRIKRTNGSKTYEYTYAGSELVHMSVDGVHLRFGHTPDGVPFNVVYGWETYFYVTNLQGDVVAILDSYGDPMVYYTYDAWGNILSITGQKADTLGVLNPFRYRGYVYDQETGLYYLQSRYYNPKIGRWINADGVLSEVGGELLGYNMFAYCFNNPVNMSDPTGNWPSWGQIFAAVAVVAAVAVTVATLGAAAPAAACTLTLTGMSLGVGYTAAHAVAVGAVVVTTAVAAAYAGDTAYAAVTGESLLLDTVFQGNTEAYNAGFAVANIATAGMLQAAALSPGVCFVAGTPVLAECGYIAIEEIRAGDMVWAWDEKTGDVALKEVVETYINETDALIHVLVNGEEIVSTPSHPFYSPVKGWTEACKLRAGDILVLANGEYVVVEAIQHELLETPVTVYNFEVADFHTYYVSESSILVHNVCGSRSALPKNGTKLNSSDALDLADDFLGNGYSEMSPGRFVSSDGLRQVRMTASDLATINNHAGAPHLNFETLVPNLLKPGKFQITGNSHVFIFD